MVPNYSSQLQKILEVQVDILDIHPLLEKVFPVAVVENDHFLIYDKRPSNLEYVLIKMVATQMPIPTGVRAAFPLESYEDKMACIVTGDVFDELAGYVTIFHEFIHCQQGESYEPELKQNLVVARRAQEAKDIMWEINYPFPYTAVEFVELYEIFLQKSDVFETEIIRQQLRTLLNEVDYEYMVWQEWKEGFARYIENRINHRLGLPENHAGKKPPFSRVTFYEGGAHFIEILDKQNPDLLIDIEQLFWRMFH